MAILHSYVPHSCPISVGKHLARLPVICSSHSLSGLFPAVLFLAHSTPVTLASCSSSGDIVPFTHLQLHSNATFIGNSTKITSFKHKVGNPYTPFFLALILCLTSTTNFILYTRLIFLNCGLSSNRM